VTQLSGELRVSVDDRSPQEVFGFLVGDVSSLLSIVKRIEHNPQGRLEVGTRVTAHLRWWQRVTYVIEVLDHEKRRCLLKITEAPKGVSGEITLAIRKARRGSILILQFDISSPEELMFEVDPFDKLTSMIKAALEQPE
jgi:hypothetical protein